MRNHSNSLELYKYLESLGIEPNYTLKNGLTPLHSLTYKNKDNNVFNYFIKKGIDVNQQDKDGNRFDVFLIYCWVVINYYGKKHIGCINTI